MLNLSTSYIVQFDIAAIILTTMLLITLMLRRTFSTLAIMQYGHLLFCNLISAIADLISAYTICNPEIVSLPVNYIVSTIYILFLNVMAVFFMMYVIAAIRKSLGTKEERILWISMIAYLAVLTLTTPITKAVFYFDANNVYRHGPLFSSLYLISAISILYSGYLILKHRLSMSRFQIYTDFSFIVLIISSLIFQVLIPNCLIENFVVATACVMMNVALDNPAIYFYQNSGCYNQNAFDAQIDAKLRSNAEFTLVAYTYDDLSIIKKQLTKKEFEELILVTIKRSQKITGRKNIFILKGETFVTICEKDSAGKLIETIEAALMRPFNFTTGKAATASPHFCLLQFPGEAKTVNLVNLVIQDTLSHIYRKTGEHIISDASKLLNDLRQEDETVHVLRDAIKNDGITVMYQPLYDQKAGKFTCAEALVRLHDRYGKLSPEDFIPVAEKNGLILEIGEAVVEQVCSFLQESCCEDYGIDHINVNLSMLQLVNRSEIERLVAICRNHSIAPHRIIFEVTETATEGDGAREVLENLRFLNESGFSLSLDDYGTGYSNINHLISFPIYQVKVDKELLWNAMEDSASLSVLENVIMLVQNFGKNCVVEGVENESMERLLIKLNVDYLQGYKYSNPISALSFIKFLKDHNTPTIHE